MVDGDIEGKKEEEKKHKGCTRNFKRRKECYQIKVKKEKDKYKNMEN